MADEREKMVPTRGWLRGVVDDHKRFARPGATIVDYLHRKLTERARALLEAEEEAERTMYLLRLRVVEPDEEESEYDWTRIGL